VTFTLFLKAEVQGLHTDKLETSFQRHLITSSVRNNMVGMCTVLPSLQNILLSTFCLA